MRTPSRILFYGDYGTGVNTGFAVVLNAIRPRIKKMFGTRQVNHAIEQAYRKKFGDKVKFDNSNLLTDVLAMNYSGEVYTEDDGTVVASAVLSASPEGYDEFGRVALADVLKRNTEPDELTGEIMAYDGLFILHDCGVILPFVPLYREIQQDNAREKKRNFKSIFYTPIDCEYNAESLRNIDWFDCIVTYNEFARKEICKHRPDLRKKIKVVPHGVDTATFYPLPADEREVFRKQYFGRHAEKFIICNVNRNQHRKGIPETLFSFIEYKKKNPNAYLYLHMHPRDPMGWDIPALMLNTGLREGRDYGFPPARIIEIDGKEYEDYQCDAETLNKIYNACDVYLTTTRGEGWGLGVVESMACMLPVICPLNTSFFEITDHGKRAYILESQFPIASRADNIIRDQVDPYEVADMLDHVHLQINSNSEDLRARLADAYEYALSLSWDKIAARWVEIFKEVY